MPAPTVSPNLWLKQMIEPNVAETVFSKFVALRNGKVEYVYQALRPCHHGTDKHSTFAKSYINITYTQAARRYGNGLAAAACFDLHIGREGCAYDRKPKAHICHPSGYRTLIAAFPLKPTPVQFSITNAQFAFGADLIAGAGRAA